MFDLSPMTFDWTRGRLAEGLRLYRAGDFFATHEAWESVWLHARQPQKLFLQALIQTTVAFHHLQRNNLLGATRLLTAALRKLDSYPPAFGNIDVALLCNDIRACLQTLSAATSESVSAPSILHLSPPRIQPPSL